MIFADNSEAAFSNYRMWESLGFVLAFAYSNFLCTDVKLYILIGTLVVGMTLYYVVEVMLRKDKRTDGVDNDTTEGDKTEIVLSDENANESDHKTAPFSGDTKLLEQPIYIETMQGSEEKILVKTDAHTPEYTYHNVCTHL